MTQKKAEEHRTTMRRILSATVGADQETIHVSAESVYNQMLSQSTNGQTIISMKAPALSTEFVKSNAQGKALANRPGSLFEISVPSREAIAATLRTKHGTKMTFGYVGTAATAAYPGGYGERSAHAIAKEENVSQLKGVFPAAVLALAKLKARIEARGGNPSAADSIFAKMWGIPEEETSELPYMHVVGSERTRMSAMEDRAYHALACHPSANGGYRVDMASVTPDVFGQDTPVNWQRLRTGMKSIAIIALQGDFEISSTLQMLPSDYTFKFTMDVVEDSQPKYTRPFAWETIVDELMSVEDISGYVARFSATDVGEFAMKSMSEVLLRQIPSSRGLTVHSKVRQLAKMIEVTSNKALQRTLDVMALYQADRALIDRDLEDEFDVYSRSQLTRSFTVPANKLTRSSVRSGFAKEMLGREGLPDMDSHGRELTRLNRSEFRAAGLTTPLSTAGALNLAVYLTVSKQSMAFYAYKLLSLVKDPNPGLPGPIVKRLRDSRLYSSPEVREVGRVLFGEVFRSIFDSTIRNVTLMQDGFGSVLKRELWAYLSNRSGHRLECPINGGWRDLMDYLIDSPEGWTLYYWARVSIGKLQYAMSNSILAPIAAGEEVDFLTLLKLGAKERARRWASFYTEKYRAIEGDMEKERQEKKRPKEGGPRKDEEIKRYIPPHLRRVAQLEILYEERGENQTGRTQTEYMQMVEYQTKAKVFNKLEVHTYDRRLSIGMSDDAIMAMFIEFYQARWYSIHKRIEKHKDKVDEHGTHIPFRLGNWVLETHPWGELEKVFPPTIDDMIMFMCKLDVRAWTMNPELLWQKINKSVTELWQDVANEMQTIVAYLEDVETCKSDEQAEAYLHRRTDDMMLALRGTPVITIPTPGYVAPYNMPVRNIQTQDDTGETSMKTDMNAFIAPELTDLSEYGEMPEEVDIDLVGAFAMLGHMGDDRKGLTKVVMTTRYLTYSEIWMELGLNDVSEQRKKFALGIPQDVDMDSPHMDPTIGPPMLLPDKMKTAAAWRGKLGGIKKRLGIEVVVEVADDM